MEKVKGKEKGLTKLNFPPPNSEAQESVCLETPNINNPNQSIITLNYPLTYQSPLRTYAAFLFSPPLTGSILSSTTASFVLFAPFNISNPFLT